MASKRQFRSVLAPTDKYASDFLLLIQKTWMTQGKAIHTVHVKSKPSKAGICPINIVIGRDNDNVANVDEQ